MTSFVSGLDSKVLVLNKVYTALRVVSGRRAFTLLANNVAEVISVEAGNYVSYDLATWSDASEYQ